MAIEYSIRHLIPGRLRLDIPAIHWDAEFADRIAIWIGRKMCPARARANSYCGSVVVEFGPDDHAFPVRLTALLEAVDIEVVSMESQSEDEAGHKSAQGWLDWLVPQGFSAFVSTTAGVALSLASGGLMAGIAGGLAVFNAVPIARRAYRVVAIERRLNVDVLDFLAICVSTAAGNLFTTAFMTWLITLGDWIRDLTAAQSKRAIRSLLDYQNRKAWVLRAGEKVEVPVMQIAAGETVVVYAGEMIPVDGEVASGDATVDQRSITGESMPVERGTGDKVYATSVVQDGKLYLRAIRPAADSLAAQIVRMVEAAPIGETRIQNYAEKFADRLVAPSLALGLGLYLVTLNADQLLSVFMVDYGTGIRVAAPTTVLAAMVGAVRHGVLIRSGGHMERLNRLDVVVFDKTGTLTRGVPQVIDIVSYTPRSLPERKILELAAAVEARFNHPVALATLRRAGEEQIAVPQRANSRYRVGMGVEAQVNGWYVHLGSERFLRENQIDVGRGFSVTRRASQEGHSSLMLALDGELAGQLVYADEIRPESKSVIDALRQRGIRRLVMLTGDNDAAARSVAARLGLSEFHAEVLPQEKADVIKGLRDQGNVTAMVGDGINDAPALSCADVGIAMRNGVDITEETAHVVLVESDLSRLVTAIDVSREAIGLVQQNYMIVAGLNTAALGLAIAGGLAGPGIIALLSNGSAIMASVNGLRPLMR